MASASFSVELLLLVAGDAGCGKVHFIEEFLNRYDVISQTKKNSFDSYLCRSKITVSYSGAIGAKYRKSILRLGDVSDKDIVANLTLQDKWDIILYCYASNNPESFRSLEENWIPLMRGTTEYSFLVANMSTIDDSSQGTVSTEQAMELKERFGLKDFVDCSNGYAQLFNKFDESFPNLF